MSELFQRHRITALSSESEQQIPEHLKDRVSIQVEPRGERFRYQIDTAGDLIEFLPWLNSLDVQQMRIEPLGLRAVYDSVHFGSDTAGMEDEV